MINQMGETGRMMCMIKGSRLLVALSDRMIGIEKKNLGGVLCSGSQPIFLAFRAYVFLTAKLCVF